MPSNSGNDMRFNQALKSVRVDEMKPQQLIEFLLLHAVPPLDAAKTSRRLLSGFPTVADIFRAPASELQKKGDVSYDTAVLLKLTYDIYSKYGGYITDGKIYLTSPIVVDVYLRRVFAARPETKLAIMVTDHTGAVISVKDAGFALSENVHYTAKRLLELKESHLEGSRLYVAKRCDTVSKSDFLHAEYLMSLLNQKGKLGGDFFFLTESGVVSLSDKLTEIEGKDSLNQ